MRRAIDISSVIGPPDTLANAISTYYTDWENRRRIWLSEKKEVRDYIFATDTRTTSANKLPWKNSVHIPKLCQIRDNLQSNYMATLFPSDQAIRWEGDDEDSDAKQKRLSIESYMANKARMSKMRNEVQKCLLDWIDFGNAFARVEFANETYTNRYGETQISYVGPRMVRVSPLDIVFDPTATNFESTPKIVRSIKTIASLLSDIANNPELEYMRPVVERATEARRAMNSYTSADQFKNAEYQVDGFASYFDYMRSDFVEILEFYGDIRDGNELLQNYRVTVIDRRWVLDKSPVDSWLGYPPIFHVGWRLRPDNLYAMGPLDNLVGMQYRIDHLENAKADAYDLIIHPVFKIKGFVEEFNYGPNERIYTDEEGDVEFMRPDTTMLSADTQIQLYENKMEEMAGAPKQAMGFRSPGEKTAYEIQILENGANRVFLNKTSYFEEMFLEPILNAMLETARRNMSPSDVIKVMDDQYGVTSFMTVTKDDISAKGKIRSIGARHFARNANILQNLTQFAASPLGQDPSVVTNISGKAIAFLVEELLGLEKYHLVQDNIRVAEQLETAKLMQAGQQIIGEQQGATGMAQGPQNGTGQGAVQANLPQ